MDTHYLLKRVDLRALAEEAGARFNHRDSSKCPLHGGNNPTAFHVYQTAEGIWRWHCFTNCPEGANGGTAINFYMRWRDVDFKTALTELAQRAGVHLDDDRPARPAPRPPADAPPIVKAAPELPGAQWQKRAAEFVDYAIGKLWECDSALYYLHTERGLTDETIRTFKLGYNPHDLHDQPARWGLADKPVWLPQGIVIPHYDGGSIHFVNIRRAEKSASPKYAGPRGGVRGLYPLNQFTAMPITLLAEGEFDALLARQTAHDLCDVATLGGARHAPSTLDALYLARALGILAVMDDDEAGILGAMTLGWLSARVRAVKPPAHDLTDYWRAGGNLRAWIAGAIADAAYIALEQIDPAAGIYNKWTEVYLAALAALSE